MSDKLLIILHGEKSTPGKVGLALEARGFDLDDRRPVLGHSLPDTLEDYGAVVVFGGPQSANDDHLPGIRAELDWLEQTALPSGKPLLGICLGAQQIARVLGAKVGPHPEGIVEIGYHSVAPTGECSTFLDETTVFYQWHSETFEIPSDAVHLAENEAFPGQAYRYDGCVYGLEFHPEMTREMVVSWSTYDESSHKLDLEGAQCHDTQMQGYDRHAVRSDRWLNDFLDECFLATLGKPAG